MHREEAFGPGSVDEALFDQAPSIAVSRHQTTIISATATPSLRLTRLSIIIIVVVIVIGMMIPHHHHLHHHHRYCRVVVTE
jgi:hypothetical protein